jgi:hypothetical protein
MMTAIAAATSKEPCQKRVMKDVILGIAATLSDLWHSQKGPMKVSARRFLSAGTPLLRNGLLADGYLR